MEDNFKVTFLIGAGASVPAKLPDIKTMSDDFFLKHILKEDLFSPHELSNIEILKKITYRHFERPDIESFMTLIKNLENAEYKKLMYNNYDDLNNLDLSCIEGINNKTQSFIRKSLENININDIDYLSNLIGFLESQPLEIFTLNYDGIIDLFCEKYKIEYSDGFNPYWDSQNFENSQTTLKIYRLHGSLYWFKTVSGKSIRVPIIGLDLDKVKYISSEILSEIMIYPTLQKEKFSEIYSWLNNKFITKLKDSNLLLIIGYSFRDQDITSIIKDIMHNTDLWIIIISHTATTAKDKYFDKTNRDLYSRVIALNFDVKEIMDKGKLFNFIKKLQVNIIKEKSSRRRQYQYQDPLSEWYDVVQFYHDLECNDRIDLIKDDLKRFFTEDRVNLLISTSTHQRNLWR
jgi:NAD-dependent SIR2 family protein deacetylase